MGARAGAIAGAVGCVVFLGLHAAWIVPIWFVAPVGLGVAALAGAAFASACHRVLPVESGPVLRGLAAVLGPWLVLAPAALVAQAGLRVGVADPVLVAGGFFVPVIAIGCGVGWIGGHSRSAVSAGLFAAMLLAIGPGHNIPFLAGTNAVWTQAGILVLVFAAASATFVVVGGVAGSRLQSAGERTR